MGENLLSLSTVVNRPTVTIKSKKHPKGKLYELLSTADFGPFEYAQMLERTAEADQLRERKASGKRLTKSQQLRMEKALDDITVMVMPTLEPTVLAELTIAQKETIVLNWTIHASESAAGEDDAGKA